MYKNIEKQTKLVLSTQITYQAHQVVSKTLVQNDLVSMTLFSFDKGEEISTHAAGGAAVRGNTVCALRVTERYGRKPRTLFPYPRAISASPCSVCARLYPAPVAGCGQSPRLTVSVYREDAGEIYMDVRVAEWLPSEEISVRSRRDFSRWLFLCPYGFIIMLFDCFLYFRRFKSNFGEFILIWGNIDY